MGARENRVETYLASQITRSGGLTRKWVSPGRDGVPDRIVVLHGDIWFVEVKTVEGKLSTTQAREHQLLLDAGAQVVTVYGRTGVDEFVATITQET